MWLAACGGSSSGPGPEECPGLTGHPYPRSIVLSGVTWDFGGRVELAPGSDLWPTTWGADGAVHTGWGDGGGFGGTDRRGRVSLGFARILGDPPGVDGENLWGGVDAPSQPTFTGKPTGMISVGGVLYAWINQQNASPPDVRLAWSENGGRAWQLADWSFPGRVGAFHPLTFLNHGRDDAGARDGFVYAYGKRWAGGTDPFFGPDSYLARAAAGRLRDEGAYQFFAGLDDACRPEWVASVDDAVPVLSDPAGVDAPNVAWNAGLGRYLATTASAQQVQNLRLLDSPDPWGPWRVVAAYDDWGGFGESESLGWSIPTKWISGDGLTLWLVFSASGTLDSFNLIRGSLQPSG